MHSGADVERVVGDCRISSHAELDGGAQVLGVQQLIQSPSMGKYLPSYATAKCLHCVSLGIIERREVERADVIREPTDIGTD